MCDRNVCWPVPLFHKPMAERASRSFSLPYNGKIMYGILTVSRTILLLMARIKKSMNYSGDCQMILPLLFTALTRKMKV